MTLPGSSSSRLLKQAPLHFEVIGGIATVMWLLVPPLRAWLHLHPYAARVETVLFAFVALVILIAPKDELVSARLNYEYLRRLAF